MKFISVLLVAVLAVSLSGCTPEEIKQGSASLQQSVQTVNDAVTQTNEAVQASESPEQAIAGGIQAAGTAAAPLAGDYAPLVILGTNVLSAVVAGIPAWRSGRKSGVKKGAGAVAVGVEVARDREMEKRISGEPHTYDYKPVIVFSKAKANLVHRDNGIDDAIHLATQKN